MSERTTGRGRPTLEQVAAHAGVSRASVSRVINGTPTVAEHIREVVLRSVHELCYVPNPAARSLVTQRTDSFALVVPEPAGRVFSDDQFFLVLIRGVSEALEAADKQLVLMLATSGNSRERVERYALGGHVDGVMIASLHGADPLPATLADAGVPVVVNGRPLGQPWVPYVDVDHTASVRTAMEHLHATGRRCVATIAGPQDMVAGIDRLAGYHAALGGAAPVVAYGDFTRESGAAAMHELLEQEPALDAVVAASDLMADGALRVLRRTGRRVPEDVAVVGFDDIEVARFAEPPLTTVRQPILDIGRHLARQLLRQVAGEDVAGELLLPTELIVRDST